MNYVKLAICALSAVTLLSLGSAKSEILLDESQIQLSVEEQASPITGLAIFQSRRSENMSPTLGQFCKNYGESCTYDSECCSSSCNEVGGYNKCGGTH
jgi:hypothetical protein